MVLEKEILLQKNTIVKSKKVKCIKATGGLKREIRSIKNLNH